MRVSSCSAHFTLRWRIRHFTCRLFCPMDPINFIFLSFLSGASLMFGSLSTTLLRFVSTESFVALRVRHFPKTKHKLRGEKQKRRIKREKKNRKIGVIWGLYLGWVGECYCCCWWWNRRAFVVFLRVTGDVSTRFVAAAAAIGLTDPLECSLFAFSLVPPVVVVVVSI